MYLLQHFFNWSIEFHVRLSGKDYLFTVPRSDVIEYCTERWILYIPPIFFAPELNRSSFINGQDLLSLSSCLCPQLPRSVSPRANFIYPTPSCIVFIVCSSWEVRADDKPGFMVPLSLHPCQLAVAPMYTVVNWNVIVAFVYRGALWEKAKLTWKWS